jgi:DNA mismatch endonuclease (patch repair protein)
MPDVVDKVTRSRMMSGIRGQNTKPELLIRKLLHAQGFRYRLHYTKLPGKPDLVFPSYKALILVNGCFWHRHHCHLFKWPATRKEFWREKISANAQRDARNLMMYREQGWRTLIIWECALKGRTAWPIEAVVDWTVQWLLHETGDIEIRGPA